MVGWLISLLLAMVMSLGSLVPGAMDRALSERLSQMLESRVERDSSGPTPVAAVHVTGDPLLQLPFGVIPRVDTRVTGLRVAFLPISALDLTLTDLRVQPGVVLFGQSPVLLQPVGVQARLRLSAEDLQTALDARVAAGALSGFKSTMPLMAGTLSLTEPKVRLEAGQLALDGVLAFAETGRRLPFSVAFQPTVEEGTRLVAGNIRLSLNGKSVPGFLLGPLVQGLPPILTLSQLPLPQGNWALGDVAVADDGISLTLQGQLKSLQ